MRETRKKNTCRHVTAEDHTQVKRSVTRSVIISRTLPKRAPTPRQQALALQGPPPTLAPSLVLLVVRQRAHLEELHIDVRNTVERLRVDPMVVALRYIDANGTAFRDVRARVEL